jgi:peptide/nickel transport system substrate-binding protein
MWIAQVMPADVANNIDQDGYDTYKTRSSGAYYMDGWQKGDPLILKKNPNYWKQPHNGPDEVHIEAIPDDNARVLKLQGGQTDLIDFVPYSQVQSMNQGNLKAQAFTIQTYTNLTMNNTIKPLDEKNVRQALNYALDKDAIIKGVFFGQGQFQNSPIPPGTYWDKTLPGYPYNLDKAKQLLSQSSVPNGFTFKQTVTSGNSVQLQIATILKDQWSKIGVNVEIQQLEKGLYTSQLRDGTSMSWYGGWTNDMSDPTEVANSKIRGGAPQFAGYTRYDNPQVDMMIDAADVEQDPAKRQMIYQQIQKTVLDDAPMVYICYPPATAGWQSYVTGFNITGLDFYYFEDVRVNN